VFFPFDDSSLQISARRIVQQNLRWLVKIFSGPVTVFITISITNNAYQVNLHNSIASFSLKKLTSWRDSNPDLLSSWRIKMTTKPVCNFEKKRFATVWPKIYPTVWTLVSCVAYFTSRDSMSNLQAAAALTNGCRQLHIFLSSAFFPSC
jgi:hypothetical protein